MIENKNASKPVEKAKSVIFLSQYVKDISFENYAAQSLQFSMEKLDYAVDLNIKRKNLKPDIVEVTLILLLEASAKKKKKFVLEITYAGTFSLNSAKDLEERKRAIFIDCPTIMFPYLRQIVFTISRDSGYPPVNLEYIDFKDVFNVKGF